MPTIFRQSGFEFLNRTRDHEPPHIHVFYAGEEVLFNLGTDGGAPTIRELRGMNRRNARRAFEIVVQNNEMFLARRREIYG